MLEKIKSFFKRIIEGWQASTRKQKTLFFVFTGVILVAFVVGVTIASSGKAQSLFGGLFQGDTPPEAQAYTGVKPVSGRSGSVTIPITEEKQVSMRSISGSYVQFDPSEAGNTCYDSGAPQTFCFRSESYSTEGEHVVSNSLRFPEGWVVSDVRVQGTPTCDKGSFGSFNWDFGPSDNEIQIFHPRLQEAADHCVATYCVDVTPAFAENPAPVSWYFEGDTFGGPPHDTCSSDGYYTCAQASQPPALISACRWEQIATDPIDRMDNVLAAYYGRLWSITGFGNTGVSYYVPATQAWSQVPDSAPPFGENLARSGCQIGEKVYIYGDSYTSGFSGLWSYNIATNTWQQEEPTGIPPARSGIYAPAWAADEGQGRCYLTGGAKEPGGGDLKSVYVYDASLNHWVTPLPNFNSARNFHAAFLFERPIDGHKLLCVAGGVNESDEALNDTQCYDFSFETWNTENGDVRRLPDYWWGMGFTQLTSITGEQLWMVGGEIGGTISDQTWFYDVSLNKWVNAGPLESGAVYRTAVETLHGVVYHVGGSVGAFDTTGRADRCIVDYFTTFPLIIREASEP